MDADDRTSVPVKTALTMEELSADEDVELWLFRMPLDFNAAALTKNKLKVDEGAETGSVLQIINAQTAREGGGGEEEEEEQDDDGMAGEADADSYEVLLGDASESGAYQILVQAEGDAAGVLRVAPSITRQFVMAQRPPNTPSSSSTAAAPAAAAADKAEEQQQQPRRHGVPTKRPARMVVPYSHVPQIQGLEVRFKPPGAGSAPPPPVWWKEGVEDLMEVKEEKEEEEEEEEERKEKEKVKKKRRASEGGVLKKKKKGESDEDMNGNLDLSLSSPEKKTSKKSHKKSSSKRSSV